MPKAGRANKIAWVCSQTSHAHMLPMKSSAGVHNTKIKSVGLALMGTIAVVVGQSAIPAPQGLPHPEGFRQLDCCIRAYALEYAMDRVSYSGASFFVDENATRNSAVTSLRDALRLPSCSAADLTTCPTAPKHPTTLNTGDLEARAHHDAIEYGGDTIRVYVSPTGSDTAAGTREAPLRTLLAARALVRAKRGVKRLGTVRQGASVLLTAGTYRLATPLILSADDAGDASDAVVTWSAVPGHAVTISGSVDVSGLEWKPAPRGSGPQVGAWVTTVPTEVTAINSLYHNGVRLTRARFPDVDGPPDTPSAQCTQAPEVFGVEGCCDAACGMAGTGLPPFSAKGWLNNPPKFLPAWNATWTPLATQNATLPVRGWGSDSFRSSPRAFRIKSPYSPIVPKIQSMVGVGTAGAMDRPSGLVWSNEDFTQRTWANASTAVVHMQHGFFWGSWQFQVASRNDQTRELRFWYGGYQAGNWATGGPWFVENVVEELTVPGEWFFDPDSRQLFVHPNGTAESLRSGLEAVRLETLLRVEGSPDQAVQHLAIRGLQFEHTSTTFLQPYVMPSGGDYRIFNGGAVVLTEAEMVTFDHNTFSDLGGNGLMLTGYVHNCTVTSNEFVRIGDSAVLSTGHESNTSALDGSYHTTPSSNLFSRNHIHRIGMYGKQAAGFFQSLSCGNVYEDNVVYDGSRHGFSWNDHFGGESVVTRNLVFNQMKESRVGGPWNDWDRSAYYQRSRCSARGAVSVWPGYNTISRNFFVNGYGGHANLDHDDGGWRYIDENNVCVYGTIENHDGTDKLYRNNLVVFPGIANHSQYAKPCFEDTPDIERTNLSANNTVVGTACYVTTEFAVLVNGCNASTSVAHTVSIRSSNNTYHTPSGHFRVRCNCAATPGSPKTCAGSDTKVGATNLTLANLQSEGIDRGSSVVKIQGSTADLCRNILTAARQLLSLSG